MSTRLFLQVGKPGELFKSCMDLYVKRQWPLEVALSLITINPATALKVRHVLPHFGGWFPYCAHAGM